MGRTVLIINIPWKEVWGFKKALKRIEFLHCESLFVSGYLRWGCIEYHITIYTHPRNDKVADMVLGWKEFSNG